MSIKNFINETIKKANDNKTTEKILNHIKPINSSDTIYIFNTGSSNYYKKVYLLLAYGLNKRGYRCSFLYKDDLVNKYFFDLNVNGEQISNTLLHGEIQFTCKTKTNRHNDWDINLKQKKIKANGINFYSFIVNTLRIIHRRFNIDFTDEKIIHDYKLMVDTCDMFIRYFQLLEKYSKDNNIKISFIDWECDYTPSCVFKLLSEKNNDFKWIQVQRGYPDLHSCNFRSSYIVAVNMTRTGKIHYFSVTKDELTKNKRINPDIVKLFENRLKKGNIDLSIDYKKYKKVFVLFSHLLYDFYDNPSIKNTSFPNMCIWIKETINYFNRDKDNLLILKPHPLELNPSYKKKEPLETLSSFIKDENIRLNDNIVLLFPHDASIGDLIPYMDCGLIWGSTVALELIYKKIPTIVAGYPPYHSVLDIPIAETSRSYFDMIKNVDKIKIVEEQKNQVIRYMDCMTQKDVFMKQLPYDNVLRANFFDKQKVNSYLHSGDNNIDLLLDRIIR